MNSERRIDLARVAALVATGLSMLVIPASARAAVFTVTTAADSGAGSLRSAIESANTSAGADQIDFGGAGEGTIMPLTALPASTGTLGIDGGGNVILDGSSLSGAEAGLRLAADDSQIAGMTVTGFPGNGIEVLSPAVNAALENNVIASNLGSGVVLESGTAEANLVGNLIGTDSTGTAAQPNALAGVAVAGSSHQIGSAGAGNGNVISGNGTWGIDVLAGNAANNHVIRGNQIGTNLAGTAAIPNGTGTGEGGGLRIEATAAGTAVGGTLAGQGNLISGNDGPGARVLGSSTTVAANRIGTDGAGSAALANTDGLQVQGSPANVVIGGSAAAANVISGNGDDGIQSDAAGVQVTGNLIGTDATGGAAIGNAHAGVHVNADNVRVGSPGAGNVLSGNGDWGVFVDSAGDSDGSVVEANRIGTNAAGTAALPNGSGISGGGVSALEAVALGGTATGAGNLISGNDGTGVQLEGSDPAQSSTVFGNSIGVDSGGTTPLSNTDGVKILDGPVGAKTDATIGGTVAGQANTISGNSGNGVSSGATTSVVIAGNRIGAGTDGTTAAGNGLAGIRLESGAQGHLIGGATAASANLIAHQTGSGIVDVAATGGNEIGANSIFSNGLLPIDQLGNGTIDANDSADANPPQNSPTVTSALTNGSRVTTIGQLISAPSSSYVIRFYAAGSVTCDGTDMRAFLGSRTVQTAPTGIAAFNVTMDAALASGRCVTATATAADKDTSELGPGAASADAGTLQVSPTSLSVLEGDGPASVSVARSGSTTAPVGFQYATIAGTADAGADFTVASGDGTIPSGQTSTSLDVQIEDDDASEPPQTFTVNVDSPTGAVLGTADAATVTILDDAFGGDTLVSFPGSKNLDATKSGVVKVKIRNDNPFAVAGTLDILDEKKAIASEPATVEPGADSKVSATLKDAAMKDLKREGKLKAKLSLEATDGDAHERKVTKKVNILR